MSQVVLSPLLELVLEESVEIPNFRVKRLSELILLFCYEEPWVFFLRVELKLKMEGVSALNLEFLQNWGVNRTLNIGFRLVKVENKVSILELAGPRSDLVQGLCYLLQVLLVTEAPEG
jgi:hypothetical protein